MYLAKNNTLLKNNVAYVSMATKYPIIKIVICANYEDIGHKLLPDTYDHTLMLYKQNNDIERSTFNVTPRIHRFSKVLQYIIN